MTTTPVALLPHDTYHGHCYICDNNGCSCYDYHCEIHCSTTYNQITASTAYYY